jgi:hypothetical protein
VKHLPYIDPLFEGGADSCRHAVDMESQCVRLPPDRNFLESAIPKDEPTSVFAESHFPSFHTLSSQPPNELSRRL